MPKKTSCFLSALLVLLVSGFLASNALAIGMMTEPIVFKDVLRGQQLRATLVLLGSKDQEELYSFSGQGDIANWVKFYAENDATLENPITEISAFAPSYFNVLAVFTAPGDAPNGIYAGNIVVLGGAGKAGDSTESQATVRQSVSREVKVEITGKETVKLESQVIPLNYFVNQGKPLNIKVIYENQGNVELKPQAKLLITQQEQVVFEATFPYPAGQLAIKPLERRVFDPLLQWQTAGQANGQYNIKVSVILNGEVVQEENFRFDILSFSDQALALVAQIGFGNLGLGWFFVGLAFVVAALIVVLITKKPQFFKNLLKLLKK